MKCAPNKLQLAKSQIAVELLQKYSTQLHQVAPGQGKSRIAAMVGLLLLLNRTGITRIHYVFSHEVLLRQFKQDFSDLWTLAGLTEQVEYHTDLNYSARSADCTIVDEADSYIYEDLKLFTNFMKRSKLICLTGLVHERGEGSAEAEVLRHLGLKIFDDSINQPDNQDIFNTIQEKDFTNYEDRVSYLKSELKKQAVLWYCEEDFKAYLDQQ